MLPRTSLSQNFHLVDFSQIMKSNVLRTNVYLNANRTYKRIRSGRTRINSSVSCRLVSWLAPVYLQTGKVGPAPSRTQRTSPVTARSVCTVRSVPWEPAGPAGCDRAEPAQSRGVPRRTGQARGVMIWVCCAA